MLNDRPYVKANKMKAAHLARLFLAKKLVFEELDELYPKHTSDQTIEILYKLIKNQPKAFGIYGVGIIKHDAYNEGIVKLIEMLEGTTI